MLYRMFFIRYRIRYNDTISYTISHTISHIMFRSLKGPAHRDDVTQAKILKWMRMINDHRDVEDYNYQPQENDEDSEDFELKRLVQVLVDSMEFTSDELESSVHSIPTPSGCASDSGTSLREAFEVHMCQYMKVMKNTYLRK